MTQTPSLPSTPFTCTQIKDTGITRATLRRLVKVGHVRMVTDGVYVRTDVPDTIELRAQALALVLKPHQVVCDRTAAWIYGIDVFTFGEHDFVPLIETCALRGNGPCRRKEVDGHIRDLEASEITTIEGIRVTTPLRTALDLACLLERRDALAALDAFRREHDLSEAQLTTESQRRYFRRRGVVQQRALIPLSDPRAESRRESWTRLAIHDAGLPTPEPQVWVEIDGVPTYRLDLAYRRRRIAIEYDGWDAHLKTDEQKAHDEERRQWLRDHGWTVIVVRNGDFTGTALDRWLRELREALAASYSNRRRLERGARRF